MKKNLMFVMMFLLFSMGAAQNSVPVFRTKATDGKTYSPAVLAQKPSFVVFLKVGCPSNSEAIPHLNRLQAELGTRGQLVAFINGDLKAATNEVTKLGIRFAVIPDPSKKIIDAFGVKHALDFTVVNKNGRWSTLWTGLGAKQLKSAMDSLSKQGVKFPNVSPSKFPSRTISGCSL